MAVQSTETCWLIVSFLLNSKYRENVSQNKSNSIIKMRVKKKEKSWRRKTNWSTCVEVLQRFRYSAAAAAAVHLSNLTTSTTGQTHIHDSWGEISTPTVSHHHCHHRQTKNRILLFSLSLSIWKTKIWKSIDFQKESIAKFHLLNRHGNRSILMNSFFLPLL